ncbi:si:dkey-228b2.6 [Pygocentrus nattereri]|uniref:si:dkey-228b2.6 n=1 Tax=Pygocentrus nattereri TaxID=42514 RepID=UPI0018911196|nr:si:dkey-228b2.6 [Pygocentrus nattereri]
MSTCEACRNTVSTDISFYNFPQKEGYLQQWIANMGKPEGWTPSESSVLCSAHFSPECFDGSAHLLPDAIPTVFSPAEFMEAQDVKKPGNLTEKQETSATLTETPRSMCDCEERLQTIENFYKLKLLTAQLQIKKYQKELSEQSHKAMKWQRKALVLQSAVKAMKLKKSTSSAETSASSEKQTDLAED